LFRRNEKAQWAPLRGKVQRCDVGAKPVTEAFQTASMTACLASSGDGLGMLRSSRPLCRVGVDVRTGLYGFGVLVVILVEKAFEARHEYGGFARALVQVIQHQDIPHVLAAAIGVTGALLVFNALSVVRRHLGKGGLLRLFLVPLPEPRKEEP